MSIPSNAREELLNNQEQKEKKEVSRGAGLTAHTMTSKETLAALGATLQGLTDDSVAERIEKYGHNVLKETPPPSMVSEPLKAT